MDLFQVLQLATDVGMFVLIWLVQLIIYPSFGFMDRSQFPDWHKRYTLMISFFVLPLMTGQLLAVSYEMVIGQTPLAWLRVALVAIAWLSTFLLSVPCHDRLQRSGWDLPTIERLVATNWIRTVSWTLLLATLLLNWQTG